jgi:hypothetical protein
MVTSMDEVIENYLVPAIEIDPYFPGGRALLPDYFM